MGLAEQIRNARKESGLSQEEVASALGVERTVISKYETGAIPPSSEKIEKLSTILNTSFVIGLHDEELFYELNIGERIKELRLSAGLTQAQLAQKSGLAVGTIHQYENNKRVPTVFSLKKISDALNTQVNMFFEGSIDDNSTARMFDKGLMPYVVMVKNWPVGEIMLYKWQAEKANSINRGVFFAEKKEDSEVDS